GRGARPPNRPRIPPDHRHADLRHQKKSPLGCQGAWEFAGTRVRALALRPLDGRIPPPIRRKGRRGGGGVSRVRHGCRQPTTGSGHNPRRGVKSCYNVMNLMKIRVFVAAVALAALGLVRLPGSTALMPIDEVKPGMVGVGRTVFEGV